MKVLVLLAALAILSFGFVRFGVSMLRYRQQLSHTEEGFGLTFYNQYPQMYGVVKFLLPITAGGLIFSGVSAAMGFLYVLIRYFSG